MQSSKVGKFEVFYENSDEFYELKREIFGENCYYIDPSEDEVEQEKDDPVIVDLGAHIGMSVLYFKMLFPKARIIAFEPVAANFEILKKNVEENQLENVEIYQLAVAPKSGKIVMHAAIDESPWLSGAGIMPKGWKGVQKTKEVAVEAVGIRDILRNRIDILKMDIEGMEYEVMRNMGNDIRLIKRMIIETHPRKGHRTEEIKKILQQNGFVLEMREDQSSLGKGLTKIYAVLK